ncbi:hypothetical protein GCM10011344_41930 [Dokdonia pacifica]|uniref:Metallo-peptidase family M12 n=1 Tax=Dokdonia pacifica TaxID=1627892 RepID=A0A239DKG0_9FLAO|nr:M12 family metallo-peptidase [Dokdonia pacifica]GGG36730.1 hypothetical protein GCM10011344_41930 [Dokdonia pacifica]SNS32338.1 Metallo-peptidase family M12 [Dokdonia pacifica]
MKKSLFYTLIVSIFIVACQIDEQELEPLNNIDEASSILIIPETEIDVLIVVSQRLSQNPIDGISISNEITRGFNEWNIAADNSELNVRLKNIIGQNPPIISWDYHESAGLDAKELINNARSLREFYKADIVVALTDGNPANVMNNGAYTSGARGAAAAVGPDIDSAYAVVNIKHVSDGTFVHEVGHLLGADHQAGNNTTGVDKARARAFTTPQGLLRQTIMHTTNTPANRILYFSNPEVAYEGIPTGNENNANNACVINGNAELVASFGEAVEEESTCEIGNRIDNLQLNTVRLTYYLNNFPSNANWEVVSGNMTIQSGGNSSSVIVSLDHCFAGGLIKASGVSGNNCESIFSIDPKCAVTITDVGYLNFSGSNSLTFIAPIVKSAQTNITSSRFLVEYEDQSSLFYFPTINSEGNLQATIPVSCSNKIKKITATVNGLDTCTGETCSGLFVKDYFFGVCGSGGGGIGIGFN